MLELFSIMNILNPKAYSTANEFLNRFGGGTHAPTAAQVHSLQVSEHRKLSGSSSIAYETDTIRPFIMALPQPDNKHSSTHHSTDH